jgi:hypothetical protein
MPRRIKIVGSGPARDGNWSITDAETGESIAGVRRVEFTGDARGNVSYAVLYIELPEVEIVADDVTFTQENRDLATKIADEVERRLYERLDHYVALLERRRASG